MKHLVFYDGQCGLCDQVVQILLKVDTKQIFAFAPLQGETAKKMLQDVPKEDSLVLIEDFKTDPKVYQLGKGALRIAWLLGGPWVLLGWISYLPSFLYDWAYRIIARNRHSIFPQACVIPPKESQDRFLP